ncbi:MAG: precorrin-3B C(17)-methyltransferase [Rhodospirillales bacterium]|nr:precorrin-3B C(17)-methyltransferase [Rhodospirillales bacterium]
MSGCVTVVGLGPGDPNLTAPAVVRALAEAEDLVGYIPYVARVPDKKGQRRHASDNRVELDRAQHALTLAQEGRKVCLVSSGDPGVFAMAAAVFEALESGPDAWRALEITVLPGISAMQAAAARLGAPLGHDFCALSLSDNLKPWETVEKRLRAAAGAGFVLSLYNPASKARPWQLGRAFEILRAALPDTTPVIFATAVTDGRERIDIETLATADPARADMRTLVMIGTAETRLIPRPDGQPWVYTPRRASAA